MFHFICDGNVYAEMYIAYYGCCIYKLHACCVYNLWGEWVFASFHIFINVNNSVLVCDLYIYILNGFICIIFNFIYLHIFLYSKQNSGTEIDFFFTFNHLLVERSSLASIYSILNVNF